MTSLRGKRILLTAGPTREYWDPVRYLTNASSGATGIALAQEAARLGADVTLILGPVAVSEYRSIGVSGKQHLAVTPSPRHPLTPIRVVNVVSAWDMYEAVKKHLPGTDIFVGAAAVVDYRPAEPIKQKIKHHKPQLSLKLYGNPDIIAFVGHLPSHSSPQRGRGRGEGDGPCRPSLIVGFALETDHMLDHAAEKLVRKKMDWIVANRETNMGAEQGEATLLSRWGDKVLLKKMDKKQLAKRIWGAVLGKGETGHG